MIVGVGAQRSADGEIPWPFWAVGVIIAPGSRDCAWISLVGFPPNPDSPWLSVSECPIINTQILIMIRLSETLGWHVPCAHSLSRLDVVISDGIITTRRSHHCGGVAALLCHLSSMSRCRDGCRNTTAAAQHSIRGTVSVPCPSMSA